jgi:hypothetical protein
MRRPANLRNSSLLAHPEVRFHSRFAKSNPRALLPCACNLNLLRVKTGIMNDRDRALD